ncbi:MAG: nuclear transport factor 2 family protein [Cyclobacteriaceae bacterium]
MTPLELAKKYMQCVFKTGNLEELREILSDDLQFSGPFFNFDSADAYINSLREDPPKDFKYEIIKSYSDDSSVCLVYQFSKPGITTYGTDF